MCCSVNSSPLAQFVDKYSRFASPEAQRKATEKDPLAALQAASAAGQPGDADTGSAPTGEPARGAKAPGTGLLVDQLA
jgi:hypothetical protein